MSMTKKRLAAFAVPSTICVLAAAAMVAGGADAAQVSVDGTWTTTVELTDAPAGGPASFSAFDTFLADGGLLVSSSAPNPASRTLAHGSWSHTGQRNFTSTFVWFRFDATGQSTGTQRVSRTMQLSRDGSSFTAADIIEVVAPSGAVVATIHGREVGTLLPRSGGQPG